MSLSVDKGKALSRTSIAGIDNHDSILVSSVTGIDIFFFHNLYYAFSVMYCVNFESAELTLSQSFRLYFFIFSNSELTLVIII